MRNATAWALGIYSLRFRGGLSIVGPCGHDRKQRVMVRCGEWALFAAWKSSVIRFICGGMELG